MSKNLFKLIPLVVLVVFAGCGGDNGVTPPATKTVLIAAIAPNVLSLGAQGASIEITGAGFVDVTSVDMGPGINIVSKTVTDPSRIDLVVNVVKTAASGPRTVAVTASGVTGTLSNGVTISTNHAPVAKFTVSPNEGTISSNFVFDASASSDQDGIITAYKWQISDGSTPHGVKVQHQFSQTGDYTVLLSVTDDKGAVSTSEQTVTVGDNIPPIAVFTANPTSGTNLTLFTFDASGSSDPDGSIKGYQWDFGDNKTAQGVTVTHRYDQAGNYVVQLSVKDSKNAVTLAKKTIPVTFFDVDKAKKEITDTITTFLRLFADFEQLSAQQIVVGFSKSGSCHGRQHEINIIEAEQARVRSEGVRSINVTVADVNEFTGHASVSAEFYGVTDTGQSYDGFETHHFSMVNENGAWMMCDFYVTPGISAPGVQ